jgi:hypothetical protein
MATIGGRLSSSIQPIFEFGTTTDDRFGWRIPSWYVETIQESVTLVPARIIWAGNIEEPSDSRLFADG